MGVSTVYRVPMSDCLHILQNSRIRAVWELIKYLISGDGLFLSPITQINLVLRSALLGEDSKVGTRDQSELDSTLPKNISDIEIMPIPFNTTDTAIDNLDGAFSFLAVHLQPRSTGTVRLRSADPRADPICDLGYLSNPADYEAFRKAVKLSKRIAEKMREDGYRITDYDVPNSESDEDLDAFIRKNARTAFHYAATCRMAPEHDVRPGVVDDELKVYGVQGLRIADCSIFPDVLAAHLQSPVVMVAEKIADMIKASASGI